jgi:predicted methyltransferase
MKIGLCLVLSLVVFSCSHRNKNRPAPASLAEAADSSLRSEENIARDEYQHPKETLEFFGIRPELTVIEISPGSGYYTEILAPYLAKAGQYIMAVPRMPSRPSRLMVENEQKLQDILLRYQEVQVKTKFMPFEPLGPKDKAKIGSADMVLAMNGIHAWVAKDSTAEAFKYVRDVLRSGGVLGIVQHRIKANKTKIPLSGYMTESEVISLVSRAGFKYIGKSEVNANPKDTADYPKGVWVLPPTYRLGGQERDRYEEIGESDRMTLKFIKK